jgi:Arc/MetJ-type ribon-helix-helix transcriptional regulator
LSQRDSDKRRISLELSEEMLAWLDELKAQMRFRSRGRVVEHLLNELQGQEFEDTSEAAEPFGDGASPAEPDQRPARGQLDDDVAIVLVSSGLVATRDQARVSTGTGEGNASAPAPALSGIQLPGFVRNQAKRVKQSLQAQPTELEFNASLGLISQGDLALAIERATTHWNEVYGQAPTEAVVEAAMVWLARDVWPQAGDSEGRPFAWNLLQQVVFTYAPDWDEGPPSLERIMAAAGILEDPFSGSSLPVRIPSLIARFVQRHRSRQKRTTSFEAIDNNMTVHSALRLLQLATVADRPYTLREIREAYRSQAVNHHPDAGGSADSMRRLNEAYQFLKDRYRQAA